MPSTKLSLDTATIGISTIAATPSAACRLKPSRHEAQGHRYGSCECRWHFGSKSSAVRARNTRPVEAIAVLALTNAALKAVKRSEGNVVETLFAFCGSTYTAHARPISLMMVYPPQSRRSWRQHAAGCTSYLFAMRCTLARGVTARVKTVAGSRPSRNRPGCHH
jgi:hypothetical protein